MIDRRAFLGAAAAVLVAARTAAAQPSGKVWRVAMVIISPSVVAMIRKDLGDLGYVEGQNRVIDHRSEEGRPERYPATFDELLALKGSDRRSRLRERPCRRRLRQEPGAAGRKHYRRVPRHARAGRQAASVPPGDVAKALGLTVPKSALLRADQVIE